MPLVAEFEARSEESDVRVVYDVPSRLPHLLTTGEAQAILVSSMDALRTPGRRWVEGVCIGSFGPVQSVRLFSKVPFSKVKKLALDAGSMTSNRLAQVILRQCYGSRPECVSFPPDLRAMLSEADACVLIGDIGMSATAWDGLFELDLGQAWTTLTGLPFVWAGWIGDEALTPELANALRRAATWADVGRALSPVGGSSDAQSIQAQRREDLVKTASVREGWSQDTTRRYFMETMVYQMNAQALQGLSEFKDRLQAHGFSDAAWFPAMI
jgi:chorismate dehydratase